MTSNHTIYKTLFELIEDAIWMVDKDEKTLYINPNFQKLLWYTLEEMQNKQSYEFWDEDSKKKVKKVNKEKRELWLSSSYEWNLVSQSGEKIPVRLNGTIAPWWGTIGIITDLSELKLKEESERILTNAVRFSTDAMILFHTWWKILSWNKWAKIIFWYSEREIISKNISKLFEKKDIETLIDESWVVYKHQLNAIHKEWASLKISTTITPIDEKKKGNHDSFLLICRDVTNRRKIEEEISLKYQKIREVYEEIWILKRQNEYIFDLLHVVEKSNRDTKSIADFIVTSIIMLTQVDGCVLRVYEEKWKVLKMISNFWLADNWEGKKKIKYKNSLAEKAVIANRSLKIIDIWNEPLYNSPSLARISNVSSLLLIPLQSKWEIMWTLSLYTQADKKIQIFENDFIEQYAKVIELVMSTSMNS